MAGDDFEESEVADEAQEEEYQESEEPNAMRRRQETVFCPRDGEYMPYKVKGALVVRRCPKCGLERESS